MLIEKIQKLSLEARKKRDTEKAGVLTTLLSQVKTEAINSGDRDKIEDSDVIKVIRQFLKSVNENLALAKEGKISDEMAAKYKMEKEVLETFLPKQLTKEELQKILTEAAPQNLGEAMKYLKSHYDGRYDGKMASEVAKSII